MSGTNTGGPPASTSSGAALVKTTNRVGNRIRWTFAATAAAAVLCDLALAMSLRLDGQSPLKPGPALVGMAILWVLLLSLVGITGRVRRSLIVGFVAVAFLAVVNAARMNILLGPLVPSDAVYLRTPGFLVEMVGVRSLVLGVLGLASLVVLLVWLGRVASRHRPPPPRRGEQGWVPWVAFRVGATIAGVALVWLSAGFNTPGNPVRAVYDAAGAQWLSFSSATTYQGNGFVGGLLFHLPAEPMERPGSYSAERMAQISEKWAAIAVLENRGADPRVLARTNVVVVLSESLGDPAVVTRMELEKDPLPVMRPLMEKSGGHMFATHFGTGTSLMEFSVLTGQSAGLFGPHIVSPYQQFVADQDDYPSLVGWLGTIGHRAVAVHPYRPELYNRPQVYERLGFDEFVDEKRMPDAVAAVDRGFVSDESAYHEVVRQLETSSAPALVHLVSMQNHVPFAGLYRDPVEIDGMSCCEDEVGQWVRGVSLSDTAVETFLEDLEKLDEPTVVLHFGDHFPGIFDASDVAAEGLNMHRTPWFVWSNVEGPEFSDPGLLASSAAMPLLLERIGAPLPPYLHLVRAVQKQIGTIRGDTVVTPKGDEVAIESLDPQQLALLEDARLVQYDFSVGERFAREDMWY